MPSAPAACSALLTTPACASAAGELADLAEALERSADERDRALACWEVSHPAEAAVTRALRAELGPRDCADALVEPILEAGNAPREVADALVGLGVAARLNRTVRSAPLPVPPFDKAAFLKHFREVLSPWVVQQARAVEVLSQVGPRLSSHGKGIVALEAGLADLRFVSVARAIELPEEMKSDAEIREAYLVALEQALEPRVRRGRDAALVGLRELSRQGVLFDERLLEARKLLSELYAGRRIDALDRLLFLPPPPPPAQPDDVTARVARRLPTFYLSSYLPDADPTQPAVLGALSERGLPAPLAERAAAAASVPAIRELLVSAWLRHGQLYFSGEAFERARTLAAGGTTPSLALAGAAAEVLARGPRDAAEMMLKSPTLPAALRQTAPLDALAKGAGPAAAFAEFDAAYLRNLSPPEDDASFWREQSGRFERAARKLRDPSHKAAASDLAAAARDTERALSGVGAPSPR